MFFPFLRLSFGPKACFLIYQNHFYKPQLISALCFTPAFPFYSNQPRDHRSLCQNRLNVSANHFMPCEYILPLHFFPFFHSVHILLDFRLFRNSARSYYVLLKFVSTFMFYFFLISFDAKYPIRFCSYDHISLLNHFNYFED